MKLTQIKIIFNNLKNVLQKILAFLVYIIMVLVYFVCITPFGLIAILFKDYLKLKPDPSWEEAKEIGDVAEFLKAQ